MSNWAVKLREKLKSYREIYKELSYTDMGKEKKYFIIDDLVLAVLDKNKEIREIILGDKMPEFNREQMQARAFRELVENMEKVKGE